jgi:TPR repeat protein
MRKLMFTLLALLMGVTVSAQSADKLYEQGKALYDAEKYKEAVPKLRQAAEKGHKKAQYRLGRCYDKGRGLEENDEKAVEWYRKSAAQDYHKAQYELGKCYKNGEGVKKDRKKAVELFIKAARQDNAEAQYALGKSYLKGKGIAADEKKARQWLRKAVNNPKGGKDILADIRKEAAEGDEDAKTILKMVK